MVEEETKASRDQEAVVALTGSQSVKEPGRAFPPLQVHSTGLGLL